MAELKPCPFCGGEPVIYEHPDSGIYGPSYTLGCGADIEHLHFDHTVETAPFDTVGEAVKAWNTRHERTCYPVSDSDGFRVWSKCSECGHGIWEKSDRWNYCPSCGAKVVDDD